MSSLQQRPPTTPSVAADRTELVVLLDASSSMAPLADMARTGFDSFIDGQKAVPGEVNVTYVTFNEAPTTVFEGLNIHSVPPAQFYPLGMTAIRDALGTQIARTMERISKHPARSVVFLLISDGVDNASSVFDKLTIRTMVDHCRAIGWQFVFIGNGQWAYSAAAQLGIPDTHTGTFTDIKQLFARLHESMKLLRSGKEFKLLAERN